MTPVRVVVPEGIDDPARPSGGNTYDRRICAGLAVLGWSVEVRAVPGPWPCPDAPALAALADVVRGLPDGAVLLIDGLLASATPDVLVPESARVRLVVLVHLPLGVGRPGDDVTAWRERDVLAAAAAVVTTSRWTRQWLLDRYALLPDRVHVARPGVDPAAAASGTSSGGRLLCVGAVTPLKGHDVLVRALATLVELAWRCVCVGSLDRDPGFAAAVRAQTTAAGIEHRVSFVGARGPADVADRYATADLLVLPSRVETYGMVVVEALAHGLPVVASGVGGVPEALGRARDGSLPGVLVPPDDPAALGRALRDWLCEAERRAALRRSALDRRTTLSGWSDTSERVSRVLHAVAA